LKSPLISTSKKQKKCQNRFTEFYPTDVIKIASLTVIFQYNCHFVT